MSGEAGWSARTRILRLGEPSRDRPGFVNSPVSRGSTVVFPTLAEHRATREDPFARTLSYGATGGPTQFALEDCIAGIEGGTRTQLAPSGLAAATLALLAYLKSGDHCLVCDGVYGPVRRFCDTMGKDLGIETSYFAPDATAAQIRALLRPETRVIYAESPASHTMEFLDVGMLADLAKRHGASLLIDNTWGVHLFQPFAHGADCSIQAATKYLGGHSDLTLGAVTTRADADWGRVRRAGYTLGYTVGPDDCWLAMRGIRTLSVRLKAHMESALQVAQWLRARPEVATVLHPAFPECPGHAIWKRDYSGANGLFSILLSPKFSPHAVEAMVESLKLFRIGASWGGYESLVFPTRVTRTAKREDAASLMCRLHVGLEDPQDLIDDLEQGFAALHAAAGS